jgi:hypothetical protein
MDMEYFNEYLKYEQLGIKSKETEIRKRGGIDALDNKISAMNDEKFREMRGDIDKKGNKLKNKGCG